MSSQPDVEAAIHPLPADAQTRNLLLFAGCVGMQYLAAPVLYVGATHAAMLKRMESSNFLANSPETVYYFFAFVPVLITALLPSVRWLKPLLTGCYLLAALAAAGVALGVWLGVSPQVLGSAVVTQGVLTGMTIPLAITLVWEAMARGVAESRRGSTLALAYGGGPLLAAVGSLGSGALLNGEVLGSKLWEPWAFPANYGAVFAAAVIPLLLASFFASRFVVAPDATEEPSSASQSGLGLAGLAEFWTNPLLRWISLVTILLYAGNTIVANLTLNTQQAMTSDPSDYVMSQTAIRFGTKALAGMLLGLLVAKTSPRAGLLATGLVYLLAPTYAAFATGLAYLATFPIYGAGELVGVYAPNYLLAASRPRDLRRNMAVANLLMVPAAPLGLVFGAVSDMVGKRSTEAEGYRASFLLCTAIMGLGLVLAWRWLPPRPRPPAD
jgi:MFS family permease